MTRKTDSQRPANASAWERIDRYLVGLKRRRTSRQTHSLQPRTEPETPRPMLSTLPFLALLLGLGVLAIAIILTAWPGSRERPRPEPQQSEPGRAPPGWIERSKADR